MPFTPRNNKTPRPSTPPAMPTSPNGDSWFPTTDVNITLYVDVSNFDQLTNDNIDQYVYFADNQGDVENGSVENYKSTLHSNSQIMWSGAVQNIKSNNNNKFYVNVYWVEMTTPTNPPSIVFSDATAAGGRTNVDGRVSTNPTKDRDLEYFIYFLVGHTNPHGPPTEKTFMIDPKLRINN